MKVKKTVEIDSNELIRFLREKLNITASTGEIDAFAEVSEVGGFGSGQKKLLSLKLSWEEGSGGSQWDR